MFPLVTNTSERVQSYLRWIQMFWKQSLEINHESNWNVRRKVNEIYNF